MSFTSFGNASTTRSCTTNSNQVPCTVGIYPAAVGVWGTAGASINGSTGVPTIATTRFYLDPSTNATVSSSVICNWEQYSSAYVVPGKNASEAGYYTVNSDCALVGVLRRDQEFNWKYPAISATYPNPKLDLGSKFETWYNTCPTSTGLPEQTTTTSLIYSDTWSQKWPMPFYWMPELSNYLPDVPEVTSCSIYLYGSPQTLKPASHLTENVLLARATTAAQPADTPQPEAPQTTPADAPQESTTANPAPNSALQPTNEAANPQQPSPPNPTPTADADGPSATSSREGGDAPAQGDDADPTPINQDPIWSAIGDAAEQASGTAPASPPQAGASSSPDNEDDSDSDAAIPIVGQPQDSSNDIADSDSNGANGSSGSSNGDESAVSPAGQGNANSGNGIDTDGASSKDGTGSSENSQNGDGSTSDNDSTSTATTGQNGSGSESGTNQGELDGSESTETDTEGGESSNGGIILGTVPSQTDITKNDSGPNEDSPGSSNVLPEGKTGITEPTPGAALTFAGPQATPAVTLVPVGDSSNDAIESIVAAGSVSFVDGAVVIGSQTVQPGGPAVTISGDGFSPVVSIPAETRDPELVATVLGVNGLQAVTLSAESGILGPEVESLISQESIRVTGSGFVIASQTLVPGGSAVTISDQDATYIVSLPSAASSGPLGTIAISKVNCTQAEDLNGYICSVIGGCASIIPTAEESSRAVASLGTSTNRASTISSIGTTQTTADAITSSTAASESPNGGPSSSNNPADSGAHGKQANRRNVVATIAAGMILSLLTHFA